MTTITLVEMDPPRHLGDDRWEIRSRYRPGDAVCIRCSSKDGVEAEAWWFALSLVICRVAEGLPPLPGLTI